MKYCIAENTGLGFYTHNDRQIAWLSGHPGNIWAVGNNNASWINRVNGVEKTLEQAQSILNTIISDAQNTWDNDNVSGETEEQKIKRIGTRPTSTSLPNDTDDANFVSF